VGEALSVGGRGARQRGGAGRRRQGRWQERRREGEARALTSGGAVRGVAGSDAPPTREAWGRGGRARCRAVRGRAA
jgi:hypothetical protein